MVHHSHVFYLNMFLFVVGSSDDEPWKQTRLETEHDWVNITNLTPGESYEIRVVAVNGGGETTRSTPKIVKIGPSEGNGQVLE